MANLANPESDANNRDASPRVRTAQRLIDAARGRMTDAQCADLLDVARKRDATEAKRTEAKQISRARVRRGDGGDVLAHLSGEIDAEQETHRARRAVDARRGGAKWKQVARAGRRFTRSRAHDAEREAAQCDAMAAAVLKSHGISQSFRPLPKVAFFAAYQGGDDKNGIAARRILRSINMPRARIELALRIAYNPTPHQPRRDVCSGKRSEQSRYQLREGRQLDERQHSHPGAIRVLQYAAFLWLAKSRTRRRGFMGVVRGFGRGVFEAIGRCSKDAVTGHSDGAPGALLALKLGGWIQFGQPPAELCTAQDRGPSGHAYNVYWFRNTPEEVALDQYFALLADWARMPLIHKLAHDPAAVEQLLARGPPGTRDSVL